ncbi:hypothetical protein AB0M97_05720 [Streptomyces sp. NPDC051207]|uniref:hypothetical protein n=1 Tax=Streptomyces sp. NPDC051207 TaxID=3154641 RepID=UPI00342656EA
MPGLRELAERTPPRRERYVDLLRALAIVLVVLGHWMVVVVTVGADGLTASAPWKCCRGAVRSPG